MNSINRRNNYLILAIIGIVWMIYLGMNKHGYHQDEMFSYLLANNTFEGTRFTGEIGWHAPEFYLDMVTVSPGDSFNLKSAIMNQTYDVHPPLHYIFLHFVSSLFKGVFSKWIGLSINVVFILAVAYTLYEVSLLFTKNSRASLIVALFYVLSNGGASSYLFIRMYLLLTVFTMLLTYHLVRLLKDDWSTKRLAFYGLTILLGGLTHYYFYFYAFFLTLFTCLYLVFNRQLKKSILFGLSALGSVLLTFAVYPWVIGHVFSSGRGEGVLGEIGTSFLSGESFKVFARLVSEQLFAGGLIALILLIVVTLGITTIKKRSIKEIFSNPQTKWYLVIAFATVSSLYTIAQVSPYREGRYMYAVYPLLVFAILIPIYKLFSLWLRDKQTNVLFLTLASVVTLLGFFRFTPEHIYTYMEENGKVLADLGIENALIISKHPYKEAAQINELQHFSQIYRLFDTDFTQLPEEERLTNEPLIVYIDYQVVDSEEFREQLKEQYAIDELDYLYRHLYHNVYVTR